MQRQRKRVKTVERLLEQLRKEGRLEIKPVITYPPRLPYSRHNPNLSGQKRYELKGGRFNAAGNKRQPVPKILPNMIESRHDVVTGQTEEHISPISVEQQQSTNLESQGTIVQSSDSCLETFLPIREELEDCQGTIVQSTDSLPIREELEDCQGTIVQSADSCLETFLPIKELEDCPLTFPNERILEEVVEGSFSQRFLYDIVSS